MNCAKLKKWALTGFAVAVVIVVLVRTGTLCVIVVSEPPERTYEYEVSSTVNPLSEFDFSSGLWTSYIVLSRDDRARLPKGVPNARVLITKDPKVLGRLREVSFLYSDSDMATTTSTLYIYKDGELVFECGIVLEQGTEGFQSRGFGWLGVTSPGSLILVCGDFEAASAPLIFL